MHYILEGKKIPSYMIEHTVNNHSDASLMAGLHQPPEFLICSKTGIYMIVIKKIIFMIFTCGENRIQIDTVNPKPCNIIQILPNPTYGPPQSSPGLFTVPLLFRTLTGNAAPPIRKAVGKNIVHHRIRRPSGRCRNISGMIKGQLIILGAVIHQAFTKKISIIKNCFLSVVQLKVIAQPFKGTV